ncbi:hypothetical protein [Rhodococcus globerulus]|uniref:Uncharacterized protein n=1 Tax=Rhodococcus globerulus TaxID=33008 RepID=A0ABU4C4A9_RHOGO|nr:hypothetical protein [Rhodococcus globerulus]MDV6271326.1 hypothetical protein [Rhodococcus globerulus]
MSEHATWLGPRSIELRAALLDLGLTITDTEARMLVAEKIDEYSTGMRVSREIAQREFTDGDLLRLAQSLALSISDEAPGANLVEFERTMSMPVAAVGLATAALVEALKVAHINLDDREALEGLGCCRLWGWSPLTRALFWFRCRVRCCCGSHGSSIPPPGRCAAGRIFRTGWSRPAGGTSRIFSGRMRTGSGP